MKRVVCVWFVAAMLGVLGTAGGAFAEGQTYKFNLPAQPLKDALREISKQTSINILFDSQLVEGLSAPALRAELTVQEAIRRLTSDKSITVQQPAPDTI